MINDDIAFKYTNHYMYQKGIIRKMLFSIHSKFKLLKVNFDPEKKKFLIQTVNAYFLSTLTNAFQFSTLKFKSLNTIAPKVLVVILVFLYEEEVPSAHHDRHYDAWCTTSKSRSVSTS